MVVLDILRQFCNLTTNHRDLERYYGLKPSNSKGGEQLSSDLEELMVDETSTLAALLTKNAKDDWTASLMKFQKRVGKIEKARWVLNDKEKFKMLVDNLGHLNAGLREILPKADQESLDRALVYGQPSAAAELRELVVQLKEIRDQGQARADYELYMDAAFFKARMIRDMTAEPTAQAKSKKPWSLLVDAARVDPLDLPTDRHMAKLKDDSNIQKHVLVETKTLTANHSQQKHIFNDRICRLVELLHTPPKAAVYRILQCQGCVQDTDKDGNDRYRLLFSFPPEIGLAPNAGYHTLYSLLRDPRDNKTPVEFSLGDRFRLASLLVNSVLYLHATSWLHHNLSSHNILCLSPTSARDITSPYLSGFSFARFDDSREVSEIDTASASNLYCHPDYRDSGSSKTKYRRSYELYSLGVILIEIGLWKRAESLWRPTYTARVFASELEKVASQYLGYHMGEAYKMAVLCCLKPELLGVGNDEGRKLSEAFSRRVVRELETCRA